MELKSFRVWNYRSINDSGDIDVSRITSIVGRNESGKSNLLRALRSLNPAEGFAELNKIKDFPRHRRLEECIPETKVLSTTWKLSDDDREELSEILPRTKDLQQVTVGRYYKKERWVSLGLPAIQFDAKEATGAVRKIVPAVKAAAAKKEDAVNQTLLAAADAFEKAIAVQPGLTKEKWAENARKALPALRQALATADAELTDAQDQHVVALEELADEIIQDSEAQNKARAWVIEQLPVFIYLDDYPELDGHQNIHDYLQRKAKGNPNEADPYFEKLCKVAGLKPQELEDLLSKGEQETRNQLANRASAIVTKELGRLWNDRKLKVRFNLDSHHMDTFVSDPNADFDVEVNLNERSRGFRWFFSFYITFSADTNGGSAANAILLLDEPGLYLHAKSQLDLLKHFEDDFENQIIYTTHSPFMVPTHNLDSVRTVNIDAAGTTVTNDPSGDARTLFPLQAALGYDLAQSLFVGPNNLIVEGVTDFWIINSISDYLADQGKTSLHKDLTLTPAGGAQKVSYMVALLTSENLNVLVLLDEEKDSNATKDELIKSKLIQEQNVVFISEAFGPVKNTEADIEDMLESDVYIKLVKESYAKELKGKTLTLNDKIPRIAKRVEAAFKDLGIPFHKTRPARLLLKKMANEPDTIVSLATGQRFETLFAAVNERLEKHLKAEKKAFG